MDHPKGPVAPASVAGADTGNNGSSHAKPSSSTQLNERRTQIAQQWASRRQEKIPGQPSKKAQQHPHPTPGVPSLCYVISKAWQDTVDKLPFGSKSKQISDNSKKESEKPPEKIRQNFPSKKGSSPKNNSKGKSTVGSFPSVLQILQANALKEQVEHFSPENNTTNNGSTPEQETSMEALRVLPAGYDWNQAILDMVHSRSRAFLLLDLASIVPTLVEWKRQLKRHACHKVHFLYTVQFNADPKLLQLLLRSNIGLVCTNKFDISKCRDAIQELEQGTGDIGDTSGKIRLYDNANATGKPDGFLRQLVIEAGVTTVVVDGPKEVVRILEALQRMRQRRRRQPTIDSDTMGFMLRLPSRTKDWIELIQQTQQAIASSPLTKTSVLLGVSADMSSAVQGDKHLSTSIEEALKLVENQYVLHFPSGTEDGPGVRLDLTGVDMPATPELLQWWKALSEQRPLLSNITVDVSHALISPAGALCTRIIGVKEVVAVNANNDKSVHPEQPTDDSILSKKIMHYYIDDGCYGSLYKETEDEALANPIPLLYNNSNTDGGTVSAQDEEDNSMLTSTVWGPTCDGLDRVCRDIPLPLLRRDQWLVFPNLGCRMGEGMGTAFNGFAPPDTAYCVLGYFGK